MNELKDYPHMIMVRVGYMLYKKNPDGTLLSGTQAGSTLFGIDGNTQQECLDKMDEWMNKNNLPKPDWKTNPADFNK